LGFMLILLPSGQLHALQSQNSILEATDFYNGSNS